MAVESSSIVSTLQHLATRLRIESLRSTTEAGSGHPTSCCSAAEIVATLFFSEMRYDPSDPGHPLSDRFVLSKGHAAPVLYAAWAEAGAFDSKELLKLRRIDSDLEGHPTPRLPFVDVATGSLGQGLCAAVGLALNARRIGAPYRTYVLLGDGESSEGSVWEAADLGDFYHLDNLCAITDVNALGQSQPTMWRHDLEQFARRWRSFGWHTITVDGHDVEALLAAFAEAKRTTGKPTMVVARTIKGKGISFIEGKEGWHGKVLSQEELGRALSELQPLLTSDPPPLSIEKPPPRRSPSLPRGEVAPPSYELGAQVATREAYGAALVKLGNADPRVAALDADVKNSTFSEKFEGAHASRFYQAFIAEQVMVGTAMGLAARGAIPFPSTFACFLTRAHDFIRMTAISNLNVKFAGSHAGVSIGEDGPSQMGLEDLAMMRAQPNITVLYPCDAVSAERLVLEAAVTPGPVYIRTSRPKTPVIYANDEQFPVGGCKILRQSAEDRLTIVAAGVTVFEALKAHETLAAEGIRLRIIDAYSVQPLDGETLTRSALQTGRLVLTVEDHYAAGGLGEAVTAALAHEPIRVERLAVREIPRSGKPQELLDRYGISASHIAAAARRLIGSREP